MPNSAQRAPLVSIITPTLDALPFLDECVQSVLGQSYPHIEQVFVDGGSRDGTLKALRDYEAGHPDRVRLIIEPNTGPGEAWNRGLKAARGDIFGCLGADDLYEAGAIEAVVEFFAETPGAAFVHGRCDVIDETGALVRRHCVEPFHYRAFANTARHIATPSAFYRREVMQRIGWLDESGDDFDVMLRIAREYVVHGMDRTLSRLRVRPNSAFNHVDLQRRIVLVRDMYRVSRRYGGSRLSRLACRYYVHKLLGLLRFHAVYPILRRRFGR